MPLLLLHMCTFTTCNGLFKLNNSALKFWESYYLFEMLPLFSYCDRNPLVKLYLSLFIPFLPVDSVAMKDPPDLLDRQKCLEALASLRHAKWFQVGYLFLPCCYCSLTRFNLRYLILMPL